MFPAWTSNTIKSLGVLVKRFAFGMLFCWFSAAVAVCAQSNTPQILLGVPQPSAGIAFTVGVTVEAAGDTYTVPAPTGTVTVDFGDGTTSTVATLANSLVVVSHTYTSAGSFTVLAKYSGDANFASASASQAVIALAGAPGQKNYHAFGDSITAGTGASSASYAYADVVAATENWALTNYGHGGDRSADQCVRMYGVTPAAGDLSSLLVGQNEDTFVADDHGGPQYSATLLACGTWVMLTSEGGNGKPTKLTAQDSRVAKTAGWMTSDLYSAMGVKTMTAGDTLTATVDGSTLYVGLTVDASTDFTVEISVDGVSQGSVTPKFVYPGETAPYVPWGVRLPVGKSGAHSVVITCATPGSAGCYVDWIGGNGAPSALPRPALWFGTPYLPLLGKGSNLYTSMRNVILPLQQELAADGLSAYLADTYNWFTGYTQPQCMYDNFHPSDCGHALLAETFMGSMDALLASAPYLSLSATSHTFGPTADGLSQNYAVTLTNNLGVSYKYGVALTGSTAFGGSSNCPATIAAGASCQITFAFAPSSGQVGGLTSNWTLSGLEGGTTVLPRNGGSLSGSAYSSNALWVSSTRHNFGPVAVGAQSAPYALTLVNPGSTAFNLSPQWTGATAEFQFSGKCTVPVPAFSSCTETFTFVPTAGGLGIATLTLNPSKGEGVSPGSSILLIGTGQ